MIIINYYNNIFHPSNSACVKMVSNNEISEMLTNKREGKALNYLVCNHCGGYYELQPDESAEDFDLVCECGGCLIQSRSDQLYGLGEKYLSEEEYEYNRYRTEIFLGYALIFFGGFASVLMGIYLLTRPNKRANFHGKILLLIVLIIPVSFIILIIISSAFHPHYTT